ncbi:CaiB/BaiF CoA transferase family protein [Sphingomonas sp. ASY06-1R]|uniref:CaiB/BaiF CoA transferase family protein n=1 Tax=Sphingomonas sp. ASY06-1R TaxID=3445771 RepID=UPI003FA1B858
MALPLEGITVADFSHVMAGPYATHLLRLMGAEVIKIEVPGGGDAMRNYGADRRYDGMAPAFIAVNAGKKSIALDLKDPEQRDLARQIVAKCDVLVENFRPGVIDRLQLGYQAVRELRPDIVYCSISGYGQTGPLRDWPAIDNIVQATSGMMSLGGDPGDPPMRVGFPVVDTLTGQTAAYAILGALLRRERTGEGDHLDVAMFDASLSFMASAVVPYLVTGKALERTGNTGYSGQPTSALFTARDGRMISLGVVQQHQFVVLARLLERTDWLDNPMFADSEARRAHATAVREELSAELRKRDAAEWEQAMSAAGIPCGMVRNVSEAAELAAEAGRDSTIPVRIAGLPDRDDVQIMGRGFTAASIPLTSLDPPPRLDENRNEILGWLERRREADAA